MGGMASESPHLRYSEVSPASPPQRPERNVRSTREDDVEDRAELAWYVRVLQRHWIVPLVGAVLGAAVFFVLVGRQPLMYEGITTLLVVPPAKAESAQMNPATFRAIAENGTLVSQVIEELKLHAPPDELSPQTFIERRLGVQEVRGTNVVKISVRLSDPRMAAEASRRLAQKAVLLTRQITAKEGDSTQEQLRNHLAEARDRYQQAQQALLTFQKSAQVELVKQDTDAILKERGALLRLTVDIEGERARLAAAEREIKRQDRLLSVPRTPAAEQAVGLSRDAAPGEVDPRGLDLTNPFVNPVYQTLDFQIAMSRTRVALLEQQRAELINVKKIGGAELKQLNELYGGQIEEERLKAHLDLSRKLHEELASRYAQSRTMALGNVAQLQIIDLALPPERPMSRKRLQNMIFGAAAGFVGGMVLILLWESRARRAASAG
jgi:succinoglycan biosynthesis transport protein ExoP